MSIGKNKSKKRYFVTPNKNDLNSIESKRDEREEGRVVVRIERESDWCFESCVCFNVKFFLNYFLHFRWLA